MNYYLLFQKHPTPSFTPSPTVPTVVVTAQSFTVFIASSVASLAAKLAPAAKLAFSVKVAPAAKPVPTAVAPTLPTGEKLANVTPGAI
ncbi:MAG: hypothetical protein F6K36_28610 [Symploca sp. SIO3C6]|nr:hypothetical protein [Symploca sp. SIO3C6]